MEETVTYLEISTKLDKIIELLDELMHTDLSRMDGSTPAHRGIEGEQEPPNNFRICTCGRTTSDLTAPCPIHGATITKGYDDLPITCCCGSGGSMTCPVHGVP